MKLFQFALNVLTKMNCVEEGMNRFECAHIKWDLGRVPLGAPLNRGLKAQLVTTGTQYKMQSSSREVAANP